MNIEIADEFSLYLRKWNIREILFSVIYFFINYIVVIIFSLVFLKLDVLFGSYILYATFFFSGIISLISLLRNRFILLLFRKISHTKYIFFIEILMLIQYAFATIIIFFFIQYQYLSIDEPLKWAIFTLKIFTVWMAFMPIWSLFSDSITKNGYLCIWMEQEKKHRNHFSKRQKWLKKSLGNLEVRLKRGNILVSKDQALYYINKKLLEGNDINGDLDEIYEWSLNEDYKQPILKTLGKIIPKQMIVYYQSIPTWIKVKNVILVNIRFAAIAPLLYIALKQPILFDLILSYAKSIIEIINIS